METAHEEHRVSLLRVVAIGLAVALALFVGLGSNVWAAGLLIADGGFGGVLEIVDHEVNVTINNGIAVTEVTQVFRNTENRQVEALYTFPVPKGASVSNFSMWINGKEMVGEVVEKERARQIYNSYKQKRQDPGLLEQVDYKTFEMRIFPIAAGAEQRVQIAYYQELEFDHDWATWVYPLATVTRPNVDSSTKGKFAVSLRVKSEIPIVEMESPSHRDAFVMTKRTDAYHEASMEATGGSLARDVVVAYHVARPHTGIDLIGSKPRGEDGYFCLTLTAGQELAKVATGADYVFILDISGSMGHDAKLDTSRNVATAFVDTLGDDDRFELMAFNAAPKTLFNQLSKVDETSRADARKFLDSQEAKGGTVLRPAIQTAYKYADPDRTLNVVLLSDGMAQQGERAELLGLIDQRPRNSRVFAIGVGNETNRPLLERLSRDTGGLAAFVSRGDDFERQAKAFRRKLMHPVATDLEIAFQGVDVYDAEPEVLPNLYFGAPVRMYGRYRGDGKATVKVRGLVNGRPIETSGEIAFPDTDTSPEVERMWAWHRVQELQGRIDRKRNATQAEAEIVRLGEGFSIVTEYTSFLVLENDAEYKRWKIERRNATRIARDRKAQEKVRQELNALRDLATDQLGPNPKRETVDVAANNGQPVGQTPPMRRQAPVRPVQVQRQRRGIDIPMPTGGGGALDPISGVLALSAAAGAAWAGRRRKRDER